MAEVKSWGFTPLHWDLDSWDWSKIKRKALPDSLLHEVCTHEGGVVLMHDIQPTTADGLDSLIDSLQSSGHKLVSFKDIKKYSTRHPLASFADRTVGIFYCRHSVGEVDQVWPTCADYDKKFLRQPQERKRCPMMALRIALSILLLQFASHASARMIQAASNIESGKILLSVADTEKKSPPQLLQLDLQNSQQTPIAWPKDFKQEEVMGLLQLSGEAVLITQFTQGGGQFPHIYQYSFAKKEWSAKGELKCLSFDTVKIKDSVLQVDCEADPRNKEAAGAKSLPLNLDKKAELKAVLPITADKNKKFGFKLKGEMFTWKSIEIQNTKTETKNIQL